MDPLARSVRKILRLKYDFPEKGLFGIQAVSSVEPVTMPVDLKYDKGIRLRPLASGFAVNGSSGQLCLG